MRELSRREPLRQQPSIDGAGYDRELRMADTGSEFGFDLDVLEKADLHLEGVTDATLIILKGHLLIEQALINQIRQKLPNPEFIDKARLSFFQLVQIARASFFLKDADGRRDNFYAKCWDAIEALNTIRNRLAHNLEPGDLSDLLRRLQVASEDPSVELNDERVVQQLSITLGFLVAFMSGLLVAEASARSTWSTK